MRIVSLRSAVVASAALAIASPAWAQAQTILPAVLDLPVVNGSRFAECAMPAEISANAQTACVTLPMANSTAIQRAYTEALMARGWRGAGGEANRIAFERPADDGECSRQLSFIGMPHGTPSQMEDLREGRIGFEDFERIAFWFVVPNEPVCGDARRAQETAPEPVAERPRSSEPAPPFTPTGANGEGTILPGFLNLEVMDGSFLAENCSHIPQMPRWLRMARISEQCVATTDLTDTRWDDRYHAGILEAGWRLREREGSSREYTRRTEAGCTQDLSMVGNAIVNSPEARQGRRIVDRSAITHHVLLFMLYPPRCPRETRQ